MDSVEGQLWSPSRHAVSVNYSRIPGHEHKQRMLAGIDSIWTCFFDDDDTMDPTFVQLAELNAGDRPEVDVWSPWPHDFGSYCQVDFDRELLAVASVIAHCSVVRTEWFHRVGIPQRAGYDWHFWNQLADKGAVFAYIQTPCWNYRRHASQESVLHPTNTRAGTG